MTQNITKLLVLRSSLLHILEMLNSKKNSRPVNHPYQSLSMLRAPLRLKQLTGHAADAPKTVEPQSTSRLSRRGSGLWNTLTLQTNLSISWSFRTISGKSRQAQPRPQAGASSPWAKWACLKVDRTLRTPSSCKCYLSNNDLWSPVSSWK